MHRGEDQVATVALSGKSVAQQLFIKIIMFIDIPLQSTLDLESIICSNNPCPSPVVLVAKKGCSLGFCIDLRKLNALIIKNACSLPYT